MKAAHLVVRFAPILAIIAVAVLVAAIVARRQLVIYRVVGSSMEPTLDDGDIIVAWRISPGLYDHCMENSVRRGDVLVFTVLVEQRGVLLKRVVGLPGDHIWMRDGVLFVNGQSIPAAGDSDKTRPDPSKGKPGSWHYSFLIPEIRSHSYNPTGTCWGPIVVPESSCFVLGDRRNASGDSRAFGFVTMPELVARAFLAGSWKRGIRWLPVRYPVPGRKSH